MKICVISDTHTKHKKFRHIEGIPECDVLVHCGDFTWTGKYWEVNNFMRWFLDQPAKHKILISGNHEETFDRGHKSYNPSAYHLVAGCTEENFHYLQDSAVTIDGVKFYGTPWTPRFYDWAFNGIPDKDLPYQAGGVSLTEMYSRIHEDTNVLICHGPPYDILDRSENGDVRTGSVEIRRVTQKLLNLRLYLCGHIHESRGVERADGGVTFVNASSLDRSYETLHPPYVIELDDDGFVESVKTTLYGEEREQ